MGTGRRSSAIISIERPEIRLGLTICALCWLIPSSVFALSVPRSIINRGSLNLHQRASFWQLSAVAVEAEKWKSLFGHDSHGLGDQEIDGNIAAKSRQILPTIRKSWRRRSARSVDEGIRSDKTETTTSQLLTILNKLTTGDSKKQVTARTIKALIKALADETAGLEVVVDTQRETPIWGKKIDSISINFSRLGFKPLRFGGFHDTKHHREELTSLNYNVLPHSPSSMNEAFDQIDKDNSGSLDPDEIAVALSSLMNKPAPTNSASLKGTASELVALYDTNGDGVVDFEEYQLMVEDMKKLKLDQEAQKQREHDDVCAASKLAQLVGRAATFILTFRKRKEGGLSNSVDDNRQIQDVVLNSEMADAKAAAYNVTNDGVGNVFTRGSGSIVLSGLKLDMRRLLFGSIPIISEITPGGPLVLEPFTATMTGSLNKEDIEESAFVQDGLRRLVARVLRKRVGAFRDLEDFSVFFGRKWHRECSTAPVVEVTELTSVDFDENDRLVLTGRARIQTRPNTPIIEQAFKVRTKLCSRKDGRTIRLDQPELALVLECPKSWEQK